MDVSIGPDRTLAQRLGALGDIRRELSSEEEVGVLFPEPHSLEYLHIVVQRPREYPWLIVPYEQN